MSTIKERLINSLTIAGIVACITLAYTMGKDTNDGLVNFLKEKNQVAEKAEARLLAEISSLKLELQASKNISAALSVTSPVGAVGANSSASRSVPGKPIGVADPDRGVLRVGETRVFHGKISVSLVGTKLEGDPLRNKVIAVVGTPGKENKLLDKVDVGFAIVYEGYDVRVLASDTFTATISVTQEPL